MRFTRQLEAPKTGCDKWADNNAVDDHATFRRPTSYIATLNTRLPSMHSSTLARTQVRERQVLIDKDPQVDLNQLNTLNKWELVAKANEAILGMVGQSCLELGKAKAVGVRRVQSRGVVYELDSPNMEVWLCRERDSFMARFSGTSIVRDKAIPVIVEYVPTSHNTDALAENNKIGCNSGIGEDALISMK